MVTHQTPKWPKPVAPCSYSADNYIFGGLLWVSWLNSGLGGFVQRQKIENRNQFFLALKLLHVPRDQLLRTILQRRMRSDSLCWSNLSFCDFNQSSNISASAFSIIKWCNLHVLWMQVAAKFFFSDRCSTKNVKEFINLLSNKPIWSNFY